MQIKILICQYSINIGRFFVKKNNISIVDFYANSLNSNQRSSLPSKV